MNVQDLVDKKTVEPVATPAPKKPVNPLLAMLSMGGVGLAGGALGGAIGQALSNKYKLGVPEMTGLQRHMQRIQRNR